MTYPTYTKTNPQKFSLGKFLNFLIILAILVILAAYVTAMFPQMFRYKDYILESTFPLIIGFLILFMLRVLVYIFLKNKVRTSDGFLELKKDEIILKNKNYPISEVEKIRLIGNDIKGDFRGNISKGTNNHMILYLKNGENLKVDFGQTDETNLKLDKEILKSYLDAHKLSEANFENIMNNTNYY